MQKKISMGLAGIGQNFLLEWAGLDFSFWAWLVCPVDKELLEREAYSRASDVLNGQKLSSSLMCVFSQHGITNTCLVSGDEAGLASQNPYRRDLTFVVNGKCNSSCCTYPAALKESRHVCNFIVVLLHGCVVLCFCHTHCTVCISSSFILWLQRGSSHRKLLIEALSLTH